MRSKEESNTTQKSGITTYLSIITLNVTGPNSPVKRHRLVDWIEIQDPTICCLHGTYLTGKDKHRLRAKGWKKGFSGKWSPNTNRGSYTHI
jgi:hypothetical protein